MHIEKHLNITAMATIQPINLNDIRLINENLDRSKIFIHFFSTEKTMIRTIDSAELHRFTNIRSREGMAEAKRYICDLINEKYLLPQHITRVELSRNDERFFELHSMNELGILDDAQKDELDALTASDF